MARANFVKAARKDYPDHGIRKGESYYWWQFQFGPKHYSKTPPKASQLTRSEFASTLLSAEEQFHELKADAYDSVESFKEAVDAIKGDLESLRDDTDEKFNNMPESLQQGDTGQLLETRVSELDDLISSFDSLDAEEPDELDEEELAEEMELSGESAEEIKKRRVKEKIEELIEEIQGFNWGID